MRRSRPGSRTTSVSIQVPPAATAWMHPASSSSEEVLRTTPAAPACRKRNASLSLMSVPQTITAVGFSPVLSRRNQSITVGAPNPLSTTRIEGWRWRTAATASSTLVSTATTRGPSIDSMRFRKPSMATGSGSQMARVSTTHTKLSTGTSEYCSAGKRNSSQKLGELDGHRAERKLGQVDPAVTERILHERRALGAEPARPGVTLPEFLRPLVDRRHLGRRNLLCQRDVRMVGERLAECQRLRIHGRVNPEHLRRAVAQLEVDHVGHREHANPPQHDVKRRPVPGAHAHVLAGHLPIHRQRSRRQHAHMCVRVTPRHQFPAQIVEKAPQRIGYINYQGKYIQSLLGGNPGQHPVRIKTHVLLMVTVLRFLSRRPVPGPIHLLRLMVMQRTSDTNPLLDVEFRIPFDRIRAEHVQPAASELLGEARARLAALAAPDGERTFDNTMHALDAMTEPLDWAMGVVRHLESVATYPELRAAFNAAQPEVSAFYTGISLDAGLWRNIKAYAATGEAAQLTGPRRRFLHKTIDSFRRHGADLEPAGKKRLEEIDVELTRITTKFGENVLDSTNAFELVIADEADLAGLPPTAVAAARDSAESKGDRKRGA